MPKVNEGKQNKGMNNNPPNRLAAIDMEYYSRLSKPRFSSRVIKFGLRVVPIRTIDGIKDAYVIHQDEIKQGGNTNSKLYNYSNEHRNHPIKGAYAREVDSWDNDTSPIKAIANSGIGYALTPIVQAMYDYTRGALDIAKNPTKGNDMIDAYLYNKTINPSYKVKKVSIEYGPHEDYVRKVYPYKNIPVYENTETIDFYTNKPLKEATNVTDKTTWKGANNNLDFGDRGVDAAGHLIQEGMSNGKKVYRAQDIWKFNPDEYSKKWSSFDIDRKAVLGLKLLDKLGTPVITRTPWLFR